MTAFGPRLLPAILVALLAASAANAGTLSGTVINRTTGKPAPDVVLDILSPTAGMAELATVKSDAQGHFSVTKDSIGAAPVLIRATYHDVSFNTFSPPGRPQVEVEIYELSKDPKTISVSSHVIIFQPRGNKLLGAEEYVVENASQPPSAFFRTEGNFDFAIPEKGTLGQVSTTTTMGVPVNQASIDHGKGRFAISFPFRPGQTNVRLSYELSYPGNAATLKLLATYPGVKMLVVAPPGLTLTGDGLQPAGQEQGMMVYSHEPLAAKTALNLSVSGVGVPESSDASGGQQGAIPQEGNSRQGGQEVVSAPSRLDDFKWYLFGGLVAMFAMGAIILTRKQVVVVPSDETDEFEVPAAQARLTKTAPAKPAAPTSAAAVEKQVTASLDSLKDSLFRLELRRQAGTISEADYAREKAKLDKLLRHLVKG